MRKFTVILMRPDYLAEEFGKDNCIAHVRAQDHEQAVRFAQADVDIADGHAAQDTEDYYPLAVFPGHIESLI